MSDLDPGLIRSLFGEDELGVVVRAHIHVEAALNQLIDVVTPHPELLPRLRYEQKVNLACALGLTEECAPPLKKLGDIRNAFGHRVDTALTREMVKGLWLSFSESDRETILESMARTRAQVQPDLPTHFEQLRPKDQFILSVLTLRGMLVQAIEDAKKEKAAA